MIRGRRAGVAADAPVATVAVRVWANWGGAITTWNEAIVFGASLGQSPTFNLYDIGGAVNLPAPLVGLQSFGFHVPEPSILMLGALGSALIFLCRRKSVK